MSDNNAATTNASAPTATKSPKQAKVAKPKAPKSVVTNGTASNSKPKYLQMIVNAIRELKENNGSSRQAILKWIVDKYHVDAKLAALRVRLELKKALENGKLKHGRSK